MSYDELARMGDGRTISEVLDELEAKYGDGAQVFACVGCWPVAAGAPYWQTEPCPAWCREEHRDDDMPDEREHHSGYRAVPLREMPPVELAAGAVPPDLRASLVQGVREAEPLVELAVGDGEPIRLRLAEAAELTAILGGLVAVAEGGHTTAAEGDFPADEPPVEVGGEPSAGYGPNGPTAGAVCSARTSQ